MLNSRVIKQRRVCNKFPYGVGMFDHCGLAQTNQAKGKRTGVICHSNGKRLDCDLWTIYVCQE